VATERAAAFVYDPPLDTGARSVPIGTVSSTVSLAAAPFGRRLFAVGTPDYFLLRIQHFLGIRTNPGLLLGHLQRPYGNIHVESSVRRITSTLRSVRSSPCPTPAGFPTKAVTSSARTTFGRRIRPSPNPSAVREEYLEFRLEAQNAFNVITTTPRFAKHSVDELHSPESSHRRRLEQLTPQGATLRQVRLLSTDIRSPKTAGGERCRRCLLPPPTLFFTPYQQSLGK
jgi:hypothetical protein